MAESNQSSPPAPDDPQSNSAPEAKQQGTGWMIGALVFGLVIVALIVVVVFGNRPAAAPGAEVQVTPVTEEATPAVGGMEVPTETPVAAEDAAADAAAEGAEGGAAEGEVVQGAEPEVAVIYRPGQTVDVSGGNARLYALPEMTALVLDSFGEGATFVVMEPSGDYSEYPVQSDDQAWLRVRTGDGLVGWVTVEHLAVTE